MIFRRTYTNSDWWYCIFQSDTGDAVLVATVPGVGCYDIAMVLDDDEKLMVAAEDKSELTELARDFVESRDFPVFSTRRFSPKRLDIDHIALEEKP